MNGDGIFDSPPHPSDAPAAGGGQAAAAATRGPTPHSTLPQRPTKLKLAILTGGHSAATCSTISSLARLAEVEIVGILIDSERASRKSRLHTLRRNVRRQGWTYLPFRLGGLLGELLELLAARIISQANASALLKESFPEKVHSLAEIGERYRIPLLDVGNLNGVKAIETLRQLTSDLGIVLEARVLKRSTFSVPRMGCITLHFGKVPEYRGMWPEFWELYDDQRTAWVTVHALDDGLNTGNVLGEDGVSIHPHDSPATLRRKVESRGNELLARSVVALAAGQATSRPQPPSGHPLRTPPTRRERRELYHRRGIPSSRPIRRSAKTIPYLLLYYSGVFHLVRAWRRVRGASRACVLLYHRVNDVADDPLTTSLRRLAEHMLILRRYYSVVPSSMLVETIEAGQRLPHNSVALHFDDSYRDVYTYARPILAALGYQASCFVPSGYVGTERRIPHDASSPWVFENLHPEDLRDLVASGFEIGSHTVTHIDLGRCTDATAVAELVQSKRELEAIVGRPVTLFAYPFGREQNVRDGTRELARRSGYQAMFSAYGGFVTENSNLFDLQRIAVSTDTRPLDLLMEIEGLSVGALKQWWRQRRRGRV